MKRCGYTNQLCDNDGECPLPAPPVAEEPFWNELRKKAWQCPDHRALTTTRQVKMYLPHKEWE